MSYYNYKNKSGKEKEDDGDSLATIGKAVGAVAGAAFAVWGIAKLFTAPSEESSSASKSQFTTYNKQPMFASFQGATTETFISSNKQPVFGSLQGATTEAEGVPKWSPPKKGWLKLNTDASCRTLPVPRSVAIGGVFRDDKGVWVVGFARRIQGCPAERSDLAELWAIREGLETALEMGFENIEIETDSKAALGHLNSELRVPSNDFERCRLVKACQDMMERFSPWSIQLQHVDAGANRVADKMADLGHDSWRFEKATYSKPPKEVVFHYKRDLE